MHHLKPRPMNETRATQRFFYIALCLSLVGSFFFLHCGTEVPSGKEITQETTSSEPTGKEPSIVDSGTPEKKKPIAEKPSVREEPVQDNPVKPVIPRPATGWCAQAKVGAGTTEKALFALSRVHARIRVLGEHQSVSHVDATLAAALKKHTYKEPELLPVYARELRSVCAFPAENNTLSAINVEKRGDVAIITPGTGELKLPAGIKAVVVDVRDTPQHADTLKILNRILTAVTQGSILHSSSEIRWNRGMKDEIFSAQNAYNTQIISREFWADTVGTATQTLPLAFRVGPQVAPVVARFVGGLRLSQRAWIIGSPISAHVAESYWMPVGRAGLLFRTMTLLHQKKPWPDSIPADHKDTEFEAVLKDLPGQSVVPTVPAGQATRERLKNNHTFQKIVATELTKSNVLAAFLIAHGAVRMFFPYFKTVGDTFNERLEEVVKSLDASSLTVESSLNLLRRFGESLKDGHVFTNSRHLRAQGFALIHYTPIDGKPVVLYSAAPGVEKGDTLLSVDGEPIEDWLKREYKRTSAATDGYRFDLAIRRLDVLKSKVQMKFRTAMGKEKTVEVKPQPYTALQKFSATLFSRPAGFLTGPGSKEIYYVNLDRSRSDKENFETIKANIAKAKAVILDMRGYPGPLAWRLIPHFVEKEYHSPIFRVHHWLRPSGFKMNETSQAYPASKPFFSIPTAYIVGNRTVSAAEHLGTMLKQSRDLTIVGSRSAGTNGNITGLSLPGGLSFSFTAMEILWKDRSTFHGVGLVPDIKVQSTPKDIWSGRDAVLDRAAQFLKTKIKP